MKPDSMRGGLCCEVGTELRRSGEVVALLAVQDEVLVSAVYTELYSAGDRSPDATVDLTLAIDWGGRSIRHGPSAS